MLFPGKALRQNQNKQLNNSHLIGAKSLRRVRRKKKKKLAFVFVVSFPRLDLVTSSRALAASKLIKDCFKAKVESLYGRNLDPGRFCEAHFGKDLAMRKNSVFRKMYPSVFYMCLHDHGG